VLRAPVRLSPQTERRRELTDAHARRLANLLTMTRRMRGVTMGPTGARAALSEGRARLVLVAGDAAADAANAWEARAGAVPVRTSLPAAALGALFGRGPVEVVAVTAEGLAASILEATDRWRAFSAVSCDNGGIKIDVRRGRRAAAPRREEAEER
jgi:ribosomal protein L7Ae-like RNA K-turn-binding protein